MLLIYIRRGVRPGALLIGIAGLAFLLAGLSGCRSGKEASGHVEAAQSSTSASDPPCPRDKALGYVDGMVLPVLRKKVEPDLPEGAEKHLFKNGELSFEAVITQEGRVCGIKTLSVPEISPPWPEFEKIQREAISQWEYEPATLNGEPVDMLQVMTVHIEVRR
jgi:hypothetical protein